MNALRGAPGYAEMEDYYDSDYLPHALVHRYEALLLEQRKRTELQFLAATQAHGLDATQDTFTGTLDSTTALQRTTHSLLSPTQMQQQQQQQQEGQRLVRSSLLSPSRNVAALAGTYPTNSSAPRHGPRASVALEAIYAARAVGHGVSEAAGTSPTKPRRAPPPPPSSASPSPGRPDTADALTTTTRAATAAGAAPHRAKTKAKAPPKRKAKVYDDANMPRDVYDSAAEARRQERFFSESRRLGKPFVPTGGGGLDLPTRFMLGDCVKMLYRTIVPDWRVASPMVVSTAEDLIAVYFSLEKLAQAEVTELLQYMNAGLLHNTAIREFHLTKVPEGWDVLTDDGYVLYTFRPPWVKKRVFLPDTVIPPHAHLRDGEE